MHKPALKRSPQLLKGAASLGSLAFFSYQLPTAASNIIFIDVTRVFSDGQFWDIDGDGRNDFKAQGAFRSLTSRSPGGEVTLREFTSGAPFTAVAGARLIGRGSYVSYYLSGTKNSGTDLGIAKNLPLGYTISADNKDFTRSLSIGINLEISLQDNGATVKESSFAGSRVPGVTTFRFGFKYVDKEGKDNFGWAQGRSDLGNIVIACYAYNNAGAPIQVGEGSNTDVCPEDTTDIPEADTLSSLALLAMGAGGIRAWRKRKQRQSSSEAISA